MEPANFIRRFEDCQFETCQSETTQGIERLLNSAENGVIRTKLGSSKSWLFWSLLNG
jgi:hypothetical protein